MLGAIIGDIAGSRFEFDNYRAKDFELFAEDCFFTDDTVMTLAIAKALQESKPDASDLEEKTIKYMQEIGRPYPYCGYGGRFYGWIYSDDPQPYNSFGNGSAMRISACVDGVHRNSAEGIQRNSADGMQQNSTGGAQGNRADAESGLSEEEKELLLKRVKCVTAVTHNHPEGIKGAEATAVAAAMAKTGSSKEEIKAYIDEHYYKVDFTIDEIRATYEFNETCQDTVPQALAAFYESTDFEDAIRTAVSVGGDSDTLAAITGTIAEEYYGIPEEMQAKALSYLDDRLSRIYKEYQMSEYYAPESK